MALTPGTRLGVYHITAPIGEGGMGQVYRARDTRLDRDVAIKILPEAFAHDADRLARFQREAKTLASLNHPNIAAIYGLEESAGMTALVMELVEGDDLSQRLARGAIPIDEALPIAKQIAEALEAAHEQGIIHRDLKPANIKVRSDGTVKVLDFGLAKAMEPVGAMAASNSMSPTITSPAMMTGIGMILGTAAYMSPEQARGKVVDKRADIWAFGCVLYEMLTGTQPFAGKDVTDFVVSVNSREPDWSKLPKETPVRVAELLRRCFRKDPRERLRDVGDARIELQIDQSDGETVRVKVVPRQRWQSMHWIATPVAAAALAAASTYAAFHQSSGVARPLTKLQLVPPDDLTFGAMVVSPEGRRIAFTASDASGASRLWIRSLDAATGQPLPNTDGASYPFWSPDGRFVAFFADHKLKKVDPSAGAVQTICEVANDRGGARGGTWNRDGVILFAAEPFGAEPLFRVSAGGGEPQVLTGLEPAANEHHHHWPSFLPDGQHFVYYASNTSPQLDGIYVASLGGGEARLLVAGESSAIATSQYLLFVRERSLVAQPFDLQRLALTGEAVPIAQPVGTDGAANGRSKFSVSGNGVLTYAAGSAETRLRWVDRGGAALDWVGPAGFHIDLRVSPDGTRVAAQREDAHGGADLWIEELKRGVSTRLTFDHYHAAPVWSPDGKYLAYFLSAQGPWTLHAKTSDGTGEDQLLSKTANDLVPMSWSPDGKWLMVAEIFPNTRKAHLAVMSVQDLASAHILGVLTSPNFDSNFAMFAPDGRWIVYRSDESGRYEVYVRSFNSDGKVGDRKTQVSPDGGIEPRWSPDGREIFYVDLGNRLMAVNVRTTASSFEADAPRPLFTLPAVGSVQRYDVGRDGRRFIVVTPVDERKSFPATVVLNWDEELKRLVPTN